MVRRTDGGNRSRNRRNRPRDQPRAPRRHSGIGDLGHDRHGRRSVHRSQAVGRNRSRPCCGSEQSGRPLRGALRRSVRTLGPRGRQIATGCSGRIARGGGFLALLRCPQRRPRPARGLCLHQPMELSAGDLHRANRGSPCHWQCCVGETCRTDAADCASRRAIVARGRGAADSAATAARCRRSRRGIDIEPGGQGRCLHRLDRNCADHPSQHCQTS